MFVGVDHDIALAGDDGHSDNLVLERAIGDGCLGATKRFNCVIVLCFAGQLIFVGGILRKCAHRATGFISVLQTVEEHVIVSGIVTNTSPAPVFLQQIRRIGHAFHPTSDDQIDRTRCQCFRAHDDGLHARTAHFVNGGCLH